MPDDANDRLSRITTLWTMVFQAHGQAAESALSARQRLVQRYSGAVYSYLLGSLREREAAEDLFQEFALRVVRGDFGRADPGRGRFRDYLRRSLINLVHDHQRARQAWPKPLPHSPEPAAPTPEEEQSFLTSWRDELLERTWRELAQAQPAYHAVLLFRVQNPDVPSPQLAEEVGRQLGRALSADTARKILQRAHAKFAEVLVDEVAVSLDQPTAEELEAELRELDLLKYCRPALQRRGG